MESVPSALRRYPRFFRELNEYRRLAGTEAIPVGELYPCLDDRTSTTAFDAHYLHQSVWALRHLVNRSPRTHLDIGSDARFVTAVTAICDVTFVDIRPLEISLDRYRSVQGTITALPVKAQSQRSVSCLHVAEHIGLGRYGDELDPNGTSKGCLELQRVIEVGGQLYFSVPVGRPRTCFNAHRVFEPTAVAEFFPELDLLEFSFVDDAGVLHARTDAAVAAGLDYGCGLYLFERRAP
ncbi:MAG TPA: DUF268 domain-containing protein [Gaiellaceae bacterium]|nr:DUF268 domain-containing protein [Gaiellaceae bacterium]